MAQLEVIASAETGLLKFNKESLMMAIQNEIVRYDIEVTDDNIKESKEARARLNKVSKALDDKRKEIKKQYQEPLVKFENDVKEVKKIIDDASKKINDQLIEFENKEKEIRKNEIMTHFLSLNCHELITLDRLFDEKWLNKTNKTWKVELEAKVNKIWDDLNIINQFDLTSGEKLELKGYYIETLDISSARARFDSIRAIKNTLNKNAQNIDSKQQSTKEDTNIEGAKKVRKIVEFVANREFYDEMNKLIMEYRPSVKLIESEDIE